MSADAIAVFRPKDLEKLKPFLDLDDDSEESEGLYAEALDDGAMLVHTFQPFEVFEHNPREAREWLSQFGDALADVHDDPCGLLFFPDTYEPTGTTYDAVVSEVADKGIWLATEPFEEDAFDGEGEGGLDVQALQALAGQLLGGADGATKPVSSFEVGRLFEGVQRQLLDALGLPGNPAGAATGDVVDEEFGPEGEAANQGGETESAFARKKLGSV